jgi:predicted RNA binding protein YcfA (HicA-like mRNA interferase family)
VTPLPRVTANEVLRVLARDGWYVSRKSGSHYIHRHPSKVGIVPVPVHSTKTLKLGTLGSILDAAALTVDQFNALR